MTKVRTTAKAINSEYRTILNLGSHSLLDEALKFAYDEAKYFHAGGYGWNYDVFEVNENTCIATGYRTSRTLKTAVQCVSYTFCKPWSERANAIRQTAKGSYEAYTNAKSQMQALINEFVQAALNQ